jgi:hypothetical protein
VVGKSRRGVKCGNDNKRIGQNFVNFFDSFRKLMMFWPRATRSGIGQRPAEHRRQRWRPRLVAVEHGEKGNSLLLETGNLFCSNRES